MSDDEIKALIEQTVVATVDELRRRGALRDDAERGYAEMSYILQSYYQSGESAEELAGILERMEQQDEYFPILPAYYRDGKRTEAIAEDMGVDVRTIQRNKKRLCIELWCRIVSCDAVVKSDS